MLFPLDEPISVPVTVVVLGSELELIPARLIRVLHDRLLLSSNTGFPLGARVVADLGPGDRVAGRVLSVDRGVVAISREVGRVTDARAGPRATADLSVRWRIDEEGAPFRSAEGPVDVSVGGLRFATDDPPPPGAKLVLELGDGQPATGTVLRVEGQGASAGTVAVELGELPDATLDVLWGFLLGDSSRG